MMVVGCVMGIAGGGREWKNKGKFIFLNKYSNEIITQYIIYIRVFRFFYGLS